MVYSSFWGCLVWYLSVPIMESMTCTTMHNGSFNQYWATVVSFHNVTVMSSSSIKGVVLPKGEHTEDSPGSATAGLGSSLGFLHSTFYYTISIDADDVSSSDATRKTAVDYILCPHTSVAPCGDRLWKV